MNPTPASEADGPGTPQHRGQDGPAAPGTVEATTVPRQKAAQGGDLSDPAYAPEEPGAPEAPHDAALADAAPY
ncbi:iron transporter, partial [Streptomyces cyaneofuscatus]